MQNEEPTIVSAPGYVGKSNFRDGKAVDDLVRRDERFITTEIGPITLGPGEELNVLDEKEKGEIVYIKVVTDNPYTNVYLELDDYRNDPNGETHAELLYDQRTSNAEGQFYIETDGSNGKGYPMIWNPQTNPTAYSKRARIRVTNPLRRNSNLYGSDLSYAAKGGQPTPIQPLHMGGGSFTHSGLAAVSLETLSKAIANPIGANGAYSVDAVVNEAVFNSDGQKLGEGNPYAGLAGKPIFRRDGSVMQQGSSARGAQFINGTQVLAAEVVGVAADETTNGYKVQIIDSENYPGTASSPDSGYSKIAIDFTPTGTASAVTSAAVTACEFAVGDKIFFRDGETTYFPGVIQAINKTAQTPGEGQSQIDLVVYPGLKSGITFSHTGGQTGSETHCYGTVEAQAHVSPDVVIKKILVKRKRLISYEG